MLKHGRQRRLSVLTLMVEDALESPKEMLGKEGDVYKLSTDMDPSGWNSRGWEGHLCSGGSEVTPVKHAQVNPLNVVQYQKIKLPTLRAKANLLDFVGVFD